MSVKLQNDYAMPQLGIATYSLGPHEPWLELVKYAIDIGYRHIDCSPINRNEKMIGEAIAEKIAQGAIERDDIFITSKLWNNKHEKDSVVPTLKKTLANLGLQYVDLYLIHWPFSVPDIQGELFPRDDRGTVLTTDIDFKTTWKGMEDCVEKGLTKSIGLCNFNILQVKHVWKNSKTRPAVLEIECHPYLSQVDLVNYCKSINMIVTAYMPVGKQIAAIKGRSLLDDPVVHTLARKYKKTPSQICIRYQIDRGMAVIPRTTKKVILEEYFKVFDFTMSPKDVLVLDCLNKDERYVNLKEYSNHKYYPFQSNYKEQEVNPFEINQ